MKIVCSNRPRPSTTTSGKGNHWWAREVFHVSNDGRVTLCGRDCTDWLVIREQANAQEVAARSECCAPCSRKISADPVQPFA